MGNIVRRITAWLRLWTMQDDLQEELQFHEEMKRLEFEGEGLPPRDAAVAARRAMGNLQLSREDARVVWTGAGLEAVIHDLRYGFRFLTRRPAFTATAAAILALGIGLATAMFSILDALILRPVPFTAPYALATVAMMNERGGRTTVAPSVLDAWRASPAFAAAEGALTDTAVVEADGSVVMRGIAHVSPNIFELLGGVRAVRGRLFVGQEGRAGIDDGVVISEDLWRSLLHRDPSIIGRRIVVDGEPLAVIGVVPAEFRFPRWDTVIWRARDFSAQSAGRAEDRPTAYVRFSGDMPRDDALRLATSAAHAVDSTTLELRARGTPVSGLMIDDDHARAVPLLTGGVLLVFLALCANVCSLLLARLSARRREFSMRAALGASRVRLIRQAFVESVLLGALGVLAGLAFAWVLISIARTFLPEAFLLRTLNPLNLDIRGVAVASAAGVVATVAAGLLPAWLGTRADVGDSLRVVERGGTETRGARAVTRTLLVAEIALACTLLTGATLLVRSFVNLSRADRGLDTSGVVIANLSFPRAAFPDALSRASVARAIEYEVARLPGVELVAWTYGVPPAQGNLGFGEWTSDAPEVRPVNTVVDSYHVGPEFFALYRIPLLRGRTFGPGDPPETIIVGERLAGMLWPGLDPIGRSLDHGTERMQVIGVAREIHHPSLDAQVDRPEFYRPVSGISSYPTLNIRCSGRCPDAAVVRQRIASTSAALRDISVRPLDDVYFEQLARPRAAAALGLAFAAIALLAAAGGLFSVLTYAVANRRREFGIRTALGASPADVRRAVLGDGATVAALGVAVGGIAAWVAARAIASVHHGVTAHDPMAWAVMLGSVGVATVAASWRPAREAARVDPVLLLREE